MNPFAKASLVEARSLAVLEPFIAETHGRYVLTNKGRLGSYLQQEVGDLLFNDGDGRLWAVELKAEQRFTGNLFLETWSNRNLEDPAAHAERGSNPGWLYKLRADLLFYHFIDDDRLYVFSLFALKQWAFDAPSKRMRMAEPDSSGVRSELRGRLFDFCERPQGKYEQRNDTYGRIVPIKVLEQECSPPPKLLRPRQLSLDMSEVAA